MDARSKNKPEVAAASDNGKSSVREKFKYNLAVHIKEDHECLYDIKIFRRYVVDPKNIIFATVGSTRCSIYTFEVSTKNVQLINSFMDADPEENYYTCEWTEDPKTKEPLVCVGGKKGIIRTISVNAHLKNALIGHGSSINDLRFHPTNPNILLSSSKDNTLRIWNIQTKVCVAVLGGDQGHRDEVLSSDFNLQGTLIMSCSIDHSLRMWNIKQPRVQEAIAKSDTYTERTRSFPTLQLNFPDFITRDVHTNYIDCVRWFGDLVLSKSCENEVVCWKPGLLYEDLDKINRSNKNVTIMQKLGIKECDLWYVRFGLDFSQQLLALGNSTGKIYLWDLTVDDPADINSRKTILMTPKSKGPIRAVDMSFNGKFIFSSNDEGQIFIWKRSS